ncbi:DUF4209 domain-containing protein [Methylobacterium sp. EM32]|uniref:DUF4209 domain-containing protein n=1 Tax=Methylobacterium sp. EM32 TaxID=3163481 RepID=UPI0033B2255E
MRNIVASSDFKSFDYEAPLSRSKNVGYYHIRNLYQNAKIEAEANGNDVQARVYGLLCSICSFHFKPGDGGEPYGPMMTFDDGRRTLVPSDFRGDQAIVLGEIALMTKNPALRARLADIAWLCRRSDAAAKAAAISGLNESVALVLDGEALFEKEERHHISTGINYLQRALSIGRTRGTDVGIYNETKIILQRMRNLGFDTKVHAIFVRAAKLDLEYGISDVSIVARQATEFAEQDEKRGDQDGARRNWLLAADAYELARNVAERSACLVNAAECHVREAIAMAGSAMNATGSIIRAIEQYREVPKIHRPQGRLEELQADLVKRQRDLHDEMGVYEYYEDITEQFNAIVEAYSGKPIADCLVGLACIFDPAGMDEYKNQVRENVREFSFMALIDKTVHDEEGKIISHIPALDPGKEISDDDVRVRCGQMMSFEHVTGVKCAINPALHVIMSEHNLDDNLFHILSQASDFVPRGHEGAFALGLSRFFAGSILEACCILVPQLENSLRHVLKQTGIDVTKITNSLTQEDVMLSVLLERFREPLDKIFGSAVMFQIEMIFHSRHGFNVRNSLSHGTTRDREFWSASHIFGCWIIYRMMMAPLVHQWDKVASVIAKEGYS